MPLSISWWQNKGLSSFIYENTKYYINMLKALLQTGFNDLGRMYEADSVKIL